MGVRQPAQQARVLEFQGGICVYPVSIRADCCCVALRGTSVRVDFRWRVAGLHGALHSGLDPRLLSN
jgi:hypothetical protein